MAITNNQAHNHQLDKFGGSNDDVKIQTWLKLYEVHTTGSTDEIKIKTLLYSLKGVALEWFGDEIAPIITETSWAGVKERMIQRFGIGSATPLVDAQRRFLRRNEKVEDYYREKIRLLRQTNLSESEIIQQLTEGLPLNWKLTITVSKPVTANAWIEVAQQMESHFKQQEKQAQFKQKHKSERTLVADYHPTNKSNRPKTPCRICLKRGETNFHWHSECPHKSRYSTKPSQSTPSAEATNHAETLDKAPQQLKCTLSMEPSKSNQLKLILQKHKDVFSQDGMDIGRISIAKHKIATIEHPPIQLRANRRPQSDYDEIKKQIDQLKEQKLIRDSETGKNQQHVDALSRAPVTLHLTTSELIEHQQKEDHNFIKKPIFRNGVILIKHNKLEKAYVPQSLRSKLLSKFHEEHGHPGKRKTIKLISNHYWWPNILKDIKTHVESCQNCQRIKIPHMPKFGQMVLPNHDLQPNDLWGIDTIVMGPAANKTRHKYIQVIIDHFSRYAWAFPSASNSASTIVNILNGLGITPKRILTDCHKSFTSSYLKQFLKKSNIRHTFSTPYHPQTNGIVERLNGTIMTKLRLALLDYPKRKWSTLLRDVIRNYNNTPHDITGYSPQFLYFGEETLPEFAEPHDIETARQIARKRTQEHQLKRKHHFDKTRRVFDFHIGQKVMREVPRNHPSTDKLSPKFTGPYYIIKKITEVTFDIAEDVSGNTTRAHASQLRPFVPREQIHLPGESVATAITAAAAAANDAPT
ncbi:Retrotransposable element Tf2 protein type 1-like protein [Dinothrombium tinctorium]|uniref:RNA-directed DNA polymerase n=1 Tax=Dinothrombium tinctorium TaxID=1965070 RepID=A0A443QNG9_9ACAR|nr:Retrotransposable element Tf2 protein type 1-like protein [Dinothrombium tinctorium]